MTETLFEFDRGPNRSKLVFDHPDDVSAFLDSEQDFWSFLEVESGSGKINKLVSQYRPGWVNDARARLDNLKSQTDPTIKNDARNNLAAFLSQRFVQAHRLSAIDPEAGAVAELAKTDLASAAVALSVIQGTAPLLEPAFLQTSIVGVAKGLAIAAGIDPAITGGVAQALDRERSDFSNDARRLRLLIAETKETAVAAAAATAAAAREQDQALKAHYLESQKLRERVFEKLKADIEALTAAYETKMQLRGPVRYWENKATRHKKVKCAMACVLIIYTGLSLWYLHWAFEQAAAHLPTVAGEPISYAALFKAGAFALVLTSIAFWIGRVLLRIFLSNQHLATDADERTTMVMTFLALVRSKSIKEEERQLILAPLFRSAADGIVKDDTSPDTAFAAFLSGLLKGGKP